MLQQSGLNKMPYKPPYTVDEILRLREEGLTYKQIGIRCGVSGSRIGQIIQRVRRASADQERTQVMRERLRAEIDIEKKRDLEDLFCAISLPSRVEIVLRKHFSGNGVTKLSLRELMDLLISKKEGAIDPFSLMPALRLNYFAQICYAEAVRALSAADCGEACRQEWNQRKTWLREKLNPNRRFYPHLLRGPNPALLD